MSRLSKQERRAHRATPVIVDEHGTLVSGTIDHHARTRWQWTQLHRAQRLAARYGEHVLTNLRDLYTRTGTDAVRKRCLT